MDTIEFLEDGLFAAIAAIGFASISNPLRRTYLCCALIAALGHSLRYILLFYDVHIVAASSVAAFVIGCLAVVLSPMVRTPAEACLFPSLLPMIPGIYAYKFFGGVVLCLLRSDESDFMHYFYLMSTNGITCLFILLGMVIGATLPIFIFKKVSFTATR